MNAASNDTGLCSYEGKNSTLTPLYYGGIPQNILYNVIFWVVILLWYSFFRRVAGDYGRIALVSYGEQRDLLSESANGDVTAKDYNVLFFGDHSRTQQDVSDPGSDPLVERDDRGFCGWVPSFFRITDDDIRGKSGVDAVQYLQFQRYLIYLVFTVTVISMVIIMPINISGSQEIGKANFGKTTITNLPTDSGKLWAHTIISMLYFVVIILFMRHFSMHLPYREDSDMVSRTLMVSGIPIERTSSDLIKQHFQEAYPDVSVTDIQFAFDIAKLKRLDSDRRDAQLNKQHCEKIYQKTNKRPSLRPGTCGQIGCCDCCGGAKVDAIAYYSEEARVLMDDVLEEKNRALTSNLGIAFVTVHTEGMSARIKNDYATFKTGPPTVSSVSKQIHSTVWEVEYAPTPDDLIWENLSASTTVWWIRALIVNIALVILLFFLTTPSVAMTSLDTINLNEAISKSNSPFISQFLPTLLLWTFAALLPLLVIYSSYYVELHWTRTKLNHTIMRKTFAFLILMVLILPSFGLASAQAFLEYTISNESGDIRLRWGCIFLPENGAFFVNYVITSAFIGTGLELIRFPELLMYALRMLWTRSAAEKVTAQSKLVYEFQYGVQYAWVLTMLSIILAYSITCPLITPFGLVYIIFKHLVDRYNIFFAYGASRIHNGIHQSAVNYVVISGILLQLFVLFFSLLRLGSIDPRTIILCVFLVLCIGLYIAKVCFNIWMGYIPPAYDEFNNDDDDYQAPTETQSKDFIPKVLKDAENGSTRTRPNLPVTSAPQGYGSVNANENHISYRSPPSPDDSSEEE
ncbi:calcium permeable stress-gated cation channel 1-like isoform X2 [Apostichopus japonicus]|uniref:calcium permeable stress-gated cation channel 1-like isoform X2 n=1 Tax=Stichopus japonicus TaxID=307972 RepID=UPI003AB8E9BB